MVTLTREQENVDKVLSEKIDRLSAHEWRRAQTLKSGENKGKMRKKFLPVIYSIQIHELISLRHELCAGVDPALILAIAQTNYPDPVMQEEEIK